jgi:hypothetical protein
MLQTRNSTLALILELETMVVAYTTGAMTASKRNMNAKVTIATTGVAMVTPS